MDHVNATSTRSGSYCKPLGSERCLYMFGLGVQIEETRTCNISVEGDGGGGASTPSEYAGWYFRGYVLVDLLKRESPVWLTSKAGGNCFYEVRG